MIAVTLERREAEREVELVARSLAANLSSWRNAALAIRFDPTIAPASLANIDYDALKPTHEDLRPYLDGWSPDHPQQDYPRKTKTGRSARNPGRRTGSSSRTTTRPARLTRQKYSPPPGSRRDWR